MRGFGLNCCTEIKALCTIYCFSYFSSMQEESRIVYFAAHWPHCVFTQGQFVPLVVSPACMTHFPGQNAYLILLLFSLCVDTQGSEASRYLCLKKMLSSRKFRVESTRRLTVCRKWGEASSFFLSLCGEGTQCAARILLQACLLLCLHWLVHNT